MRGSAVPRREELEPLRFKLFSRLIRVQALVPRDVVDDHEHRSW